MFRFELPAQLLPRTLVVDHNMQTGAMMYRFWGSALSDVFGADYSGSFDELPDVFRPVAYGTYKLVLEVRKPIQVRFKVKVGNRFTDFQSAFRLPLSDDGVNVTGVVSLLDQNFAKHDWDRVKDEFLSLKAE